MDTKAKSPYMAVHNASIHGPWENGKYGTLELHDDDKIHFHELSLNKDGTWLCTDLCFSAYDFRTRDEREFIKAHTTIIGGGIVAQWYSDRNKPTRDLFEEYYQKQLEAYRRRREREPSAWNVDIEAEFRSGKHMEQERPLMKLSEALYNYLPEDECEVIRQVIENYTSFVAMKKGEDISSPEDGNKKPSPEDGNKEPSPEDGNKEPSPKDGNKKPTGFRDYIHDQKNADTILDLLHKAIGKMQNTGALRILNCAIYDRELLKRPPTKVISEEFKDNIMCTRQNIEKILKEDQGEQEHESWRHFLNNIQTSSDGQQ